MTHLAIDTLHAGVTLYHTLFDQSPDAIVLIDPQTTLPVEFNQKALDLLGYTAEEFRHVPISEYEAMEAPEEIKQHAERIIEKGGDEFETRMLTKSGAIKNVLVIIQVVEIGGRKLFHNVFHDITAKMQMEQSLRESKRTLTTLMDNLPGMVYRCRNDPDWTLEFASKGIDNLTGRPTADFLAGHIHRGDIIHPDDKETVWNGVQAAISKRQAYQLEYRIIHADGTQRWVWEQGNGNFDVAGQLLALEGYILDITERVLAKEKLEFTQFAIDKSSDAAFWVGQDGRFIYVNDVACNSLGYTREELLQLSVYDIVPILTEENREMIWQQVIQQRYFSTESVHKRKDGTTFPVSIVSTYLKYKGEDYACSFARDITERKKAEDALTARVRQQAAVARIGQLALTGSTLNDLMNELVRLTAEALRVEYCKVLELLPGQHALLLRAGVGWREGVVGKAIVPDNLDSQAGYTLQINGPLIVEDLSTEYRFSGSSLLRDHGVVSGISVIIQGHVDPWGVLSVHTRQRRSFTQDDVNYLQAVANILAETIEFTNSKENLFRSERKFRGLIESAADGMVIVNARGEIEIVNAQLEAMTGYSRAELIGKPVELLVPERYAEHTRLRGGYLMEPYQRRMGAGREFHVRCKDGSEFPAEIDLTPLVSDAATVVTAVIRDISKRKQAEGQLLESRERLRKLAARLNAAREVERTRIARDIHDELGQTLTGLKMDLAWLEERLAAKLPAKNQEALGNRVRTMIALVDTTISFVRRLSSSLRPAMLDDLGLEAAIDWQLRGFAERTGYDYTIELTSENLGADRELETNIFRIFQEALTNVARHAGATHVDVVMRKRDSQLVLKIRDNGCGIEAANLVSNQSFGLIGMQERALMFGGELRIERLAQGGTEVTLTMPIDGSMA